MRSQWLIVLFTVVSLPGWGQRLSGKIINELTAKPVPYVLVTSPDRKMGIRTDTAGYFRPPVNFDTLLLSAPGYQSATLVLTEVDSLVVHLAEKPLEVQGIAMSGSKRPRLEMAGTRRKRPQGIYMNCDSTSFSEMALYIPNPEQKQAILHKVYYYVPRKGKQRAPFRVRIYANTNGAPGRDLLEESVIVRPRWWGRWKEIQVGRYNVPLPGDGLFVSIEWLGRESSYVDRIKMTDGSVRTSKCYGQALGMIKAPEEPRGWARSNGGNWFRWTLSPNDQVYNPMIRVEWLRYSQ